MQYSGRGSRRAWLLVGVSACACQVAQPAFAQSIAATAVQSSESRPDAVPAEEAAQADTAAKGAESRERQDDIIVTARKREERLQEVPVSIIAMSGDTLKDRAVTTFKELNDVVPNLKINSGVPNAGGSAAQVFIRGVGQYDYAAPGEPGVGIYVDGVYISRTPGLNGGMVDIQRVEILRGPQGTLYGRNTIGGAVKIITNLPSGDTSAEVGVTVGSYSRTDIDGYFEFPVNSAISARFVGNIRRRRGLGTNGIGQELGEENKWGGRATILIEASDALRLTIRGDYHHQKQAGPAGSLDYFNPNPVADLINGLLAPMTFAKFGRPPAPYDVWGPAYAKTVEQCGKCVYSNLGGATDPSRDDAELWGTSLTADLDLGAVQIKSISAYRGAKINSSRDLDMSPFSIVETSNPETSRQFTEELQFLGTGLNHRLKWLFGLYGFIEDIDVKYHATILGGLYQAVGVDFSADVPGRIKSTSIAAFGEANFALTDALSLTVGGRITRDKKVYNVGLFRPESGVQVYGPATLRAGWTEFTPRAGFEYHATPDLMFFGNYSKGYKSGGFNSRELGGTVPKAFSPEFLTTYELGLKSQWLDRRLTVNLAAFYNKYRDIQLVTVTDLGGGNVNTSIANAGRARILGAEIEVGLRPTPELHISLTGGYLDAKYLELGPEALSAGVGPGDKFLNAPSFSGSAAIDYDLPVGSNATVKLHADATYSSSYFGDLVNTPQLKVNPYAIANARITYGPDSKAWEASVFVTNITDKIYITNGLEVLALNLVETYYSRPREWGASVRVRF